MLEHSLFTTWRLAWKTCSASKSQRPIEPKPSHLCLTLEEKMACVALRIRMHKSIQESSSHGSTKTPSWFLSIEVALPQGFKESVKGRGLPSGWKLIGQYQIWLPKKL